MAVDVVVSRGSAAAAAAVSSRTSCCPRRPPLAAGRRAHRACASTRASPGAAARRWRRRGSWCATRSGWPSGSSRPTSRPSCSCCRAWSRSSRPPATAAAPGSSRAAGRPSIAAEVDLDGLRPLPRRRAGVAHLLAGARARRRADGAPAARRRRHAPARRARPARPAPPTTTSTPPCAPPPRCACTSRARAAARCCCPATGARRCSSRRSRAGRTCTCAWRSSTTAPGPTSPAWPRAAGRCFYVAARADSARRRARWATPPGGGRCSSCPATPARAGAAVLRGRPVARATSPAAPARARGSRREVEVAWGRSPPPGARAAAAAAPLARAPAGVRLARLRRARPLRRRCTGARSSAPGSRRRHGPGSVAVASAVGARAARAARAASRARRRAVALGVLVLHPARAGLRWPPGRPPTCSSTRATGATWRPGIVAGHLLDAGHHRPLPRRSTSGCAPRSLSAARRSLALAAAAGLLAAARAGARPARSRRCRARRALRGARSSSTGPTRPFLDGAVFCVAARRLPVARDAARRPPGRRRRLRARRRRRRRRSSRRASTHARRGSTTSRFAEKLEPTKARAFSWDHGYGPLRWPRDGREMLRIKARASRPTGRPTTSTSSTACAGATGPARARPGPGRRAPAAGAAGCRRSRSSTAACARRSSSAPGRRSDIRAAAPRVGAARRATGTFETSARRCARATATRRASTRRARPTRSCARAGADYPGLDARLPRAARCPSAAARGDRPAQR